MSLELKDVIRQVNLLKKEKQSQYSKIKIAFLRNYTVERIVPYLELFLLQDGFFPIFYFSEYGNIFQDVLNQSSSYYEFSPDLTILGLTVRESSQDITSSFVTLLKGGYKKEINRLLSEIENIVQVLSKNQDNPLLVHNFETPKHPAMGIFDSQKSNYQINTFRKLNIDLVDICQKYKGTYIFDIDYLSRRQGSEQSIDPRFWFIEKNPYSQNFLQIIAKDYVKFTKALMGGIKKCLVLDLDNTLWGGIVGEDGFDKIKIGHTYPGSAFLDFQKYVYSLYCRGVILAVCSKNNIEEVMNVLKNHPDMILRPEHFSIIKANWKDKVTNIRCIASELNIGLDSIVFVDDSLFEINMVRAALPEIASICLEGEVINYIDQLANFSYFDSLSYSDEDSSRTKMYQENHKRRESEKSFNDVESYLSSLDIKIKVDCNNRYSVSRGYQLLQRTNQFNLTTRRYSEPEVLFFCEDESHDLISVRMLDRFGDLGVIALAIIKYKDSKAVIDSFLVSCRALGRSVESAMLVVCCRHALQRGCRYIYGEYLETNKNKQASDFYLKRGFNKDQGQSSIGDVFVFDLEKIDDLKAPSFIDIIEGEKYNGSTKESVQ